MREPLLKQIFELLEKEVGEQDIRQSDLVRLLQNAELDPPLNKNAAYYLVKYSLTKPVQIDFTAFFEPLLYLVPQYGIGKVFYRVNPTWLALEKDDELFTQSARFY